MGRTVVISLGGSILFGENLDSSRIRGFAEAIERISKDNRVFVVVGGGWIAREYIKTARELGSNETFCDYMGIEVTRLNAMLLSLAVRNSPKVVPKDFREAYELSKHYPVVIMGGTFPGHTTDATSALLAEFVNAELLINATSVDGVYSEDPKKNRNAKRFERIKAKGLLEIVARNEAVAGTNTVMDLLSVKIIERSKIKTYIIKGTPENLIRAVNDDVAGIGTVVEI
ncbi:uridylate kinase, putative [Archaeoglobus sulfaticallidus PM70-1]|uniref:Uridylate kinase n=1 Tax=Archaeoglobus sulfaticallidus PM70-1 TaxID=387631 RepID=N0BDJ6_9EURY|nr:UMP kinase [Archaeoglobus sulfaticallidus]AGK61068.1 uridylate kinase, putative [Archaeoglobus sulfaticallidus PM70-1]